MFYAFVRLIIGGIIRLFYPIKVINLQNLPKEGSLILCPNHASNFDPIFVSIGIPRQICWMAKEELFKSKILSFLLTKLDAFPVDREGSDIGAIKKALRILKEDKILGIFPEGTRTESMDLKSAKPGVALLGNKSKTPVLPVYIDSNYKIFNKTKIYIGEIIDFDNYGPNKLSMNDYTKISKEILSKIYELGIKEENS